MYALSRVGKASIPTHQTAADRSWLGPASICWLGEVATKQARASRSVMRPDPTSRTTNLGQIAARY